MKQLNDKLKKQNKDKDQEIELLKNVVQQSGAGMVSALKEKILVREDQILDVRHQHPFCGEPIRQCWIIS